MPTPPDYPDDIFAHTRMSFGEHIEELRTHLLRALKAIVAFMVFGFTLDFVGYLVDRPWIGVGRPAMEIIVAPVREQIRAYYDNKLNRLIENRDRGDAAAKEATATRPMKLTIPSNELVKIRGGGETPHEGLTITVNVDPVDAFTASRSVQEQVHQVGLATMSVTESMMVYVKVCLLCSLILASPVVYWEIWSFIAAGMYPHEKRHVYKYLPMSLGLFFAGIVLCQFAVIPQSIGALLWFNDWLNLNPELRLNEWLSFALILPLVFGVSFQTPLIMLFLERVGIMTVAAYWAGWKIAVFLLAIVAALITPTPDAFTMALMWLPLCGLYFLGIYLCQWSRGKGTNARDEGRTGSFTKV